MPTTHMQGRVIQHDGPDPPREPVVPAAVEAVSAPVDDAPIVEVPTAAEPAVPATPVKAPTPVKAARAAKTPTPRKR